MENMYYIQTEQSKVNTRRRSFSGDAFGNLPGSPGGAQGFMGTGLPREDAAAAMGDGSFLRSLPVSPGAASGNPSQRLNREARHLQPSMQNYSGLHSPVTD